MFNSSDNGFKVQIFIIVLLMSMLEASGNTKINKKKSKEQMETEGSKFKEIYLQDTKPFSCKVLLL